MEMLKDMLEFNRNFVNSKEYLKIDTTTKYPKKELVIVSCMDTRLTELLVNAMNIKNGDAKIIKVAGAVVNNPFGGVMRSILVSVYDLGADEVIVVGHKDCGMATIDPEKMLKQMVRYGIPKDRIELLGNSGINLKEWLTGFESVEASVEASVNLVKNHPLMPKHVKISGFVIDSETGELDMVIN